MTTRPVGLGDQIWQTIKGKDFEETISHLRKISKDYLISFFEKAKLDPKWGGTDRAKYLYRMICVFEEESGSMQVTQCMKIIELANEIWMTESLLHKVV